MDWVKSRCKNNGGKGGRDNGKIKVLHLYRPKSILIFLGEIVNVNRNNNDNNDTYYIL